MDPRQSISPLGDYAIQMETWEARASLWIDTPVIMDCRTGEALFRFVDQRWSLVRVEWRSEVEVSLFLRKFPGDHLPGFLEAVINCRERVASVIVGNSVGLAALECALDRLLQPRSGSV